MIRVKLNRGETYSFRKLLSSALLNPVGTVVKSTKPISITIKDDSVVKGTCRDALGDQLVPVKVAGMEYVVPRGFLTSPEYLFVVATEDNTDVYVSGSIAPTTSLNAGKIYTMGIIVPSIYIRATKPVFVVHVTGFGCEVGMAVLPPINCTGSKRISFTRSTGEFFGMNILSRKAAVNSFKLTRNGLTMNVPSNVFIPVVGTNDEWHTAQLSYTTAEVPVNEATTILMTSILSR